ncbi:MAG: flagellar assembly protein FliH, partial [Spirochaetaceae bacterium]|nr:flagellar assembly protein FliH [Spirochaetaceae bacterium]
MTRTVFRAYEIVASPVVMFIDSPDGAEESEKPLVFDDAAEPEEYQGPTAEELRREAEQFKIQWESERETMIKSAQLEGSRIIKEAEEAAQEELNRRSEEAMVIKQNAEAEA